ncbi:MAG: error-prone DNA polymerase [Proteobacteria bacterium]|nr:error-prone DNA polymerase [Pseudomonadota bacterium]
MEYAELQVISNFSFLRGASHADELVATAKTLGLAAIGLADRNSLAGIVRAHMAAKRHDMRLLVGAWLDLRDGPSFLCYPRDRAAYGRLTRLLTLGQRRARKGSCELYLGDLADYAEGQVLIALTDREMPSSIFSIHIRKLQQAVDNKMYLAASYLYHGNDKARLDRLAILASELGLGLVATNDVHAHDAARRPLQDVLSCIREGCTIGEAGYRLHANAERHLKPATEMLRLFRGHGDAVARTLEIVEACNFSLDELRYNYPNEPVPAGTTPDAHLHDLAWKGAKVRFPEGISEKVAAMLRHELGLIRELDYAPYFLTVHDIVKFARAQGILCQGRGSAANSVVCYLLGITSVDPTEVDLLFERFLSAERGEPPDIDVDFEHERREEVIQYIYARYGRHRAALAATVIRYRYKSAVRDVGKAMGLSADLVGMLAGTVWGTHGGEITARQVREAGLNPDDRKLRQTLVLTAEIVGFPRHLSQHVGGFVLTETPLDEVVPISNAAMKDRTVVEWDKDDLDALGILKIDCLALGMLTCIRKAFTLLEVHYGRSMSLARLPRGDAATYDMLCRADSVGVFQVESRAQMNMLPRLKPRNFYDLVIEVAIVRPGPIQGDMVHPYLRRRNGEEVVEYPAPAPEFGPADELRQVLHKTLGVPLFQEQAMRIAIVAAGFTPAEADQLRRSMATFRHMGTINSFAGKFVGGMTARGYDARFAERCFKQIEGFGEYGFPESHAASFALLVYASSWLKCHYPAVFACALLNSQPMGFYAPAQIVRDAREHGVELLPVDINKSDWDCILEPGKDKKLALRLGFRQVDGVKRAEIDKLIAAREPEYVSVEEARRRAGLQVSGLEKLAAADAMRSIGLDRRQALWEVRALTKDIPLPLFAHADAREIGVEPVVELPLMPLSEHVVNDYQTLRLSLKAHPVSFLRDGFRAAGILSASEFEGTGDGQRVAYAGAVIVRQRPGTARGVVFMTLEDETGIVNAIVWPNVMARYRKAVMAGRLMLIRGKIQRTEEIIHLIADEVEDVSHLLATLVEDAPGASPITIYRGVAPPGQSRRHPRDVRIIAKTRPILPKSRDFR